MKHRTLYVPSRVSVRYEVWRGLSAGDAVKSVLVGVAAIGMSAAIHFIFGLAVMWCALIPMVAISFSIGVLTRFDSGLSIKDIISISLKFSKEQKRYFYVYRRN